MPEKFDPLSVRALLTALAEPGYRAFSLRLLPGVDNLLGVRLPALRRLAGQIARGDWRAYLAAADDAYFEETMLRGLIFCAAPMDGPERLARAAQFVPHIQNWSVCDSFCQSLPVAPNERAAVWAFLSPYFDSPHEYDQRFALVMGLSHFAGPDYHEALLARLDAFSHPGYYARMAAAWAVSVCFAEQPVRTLSWLEGCALDEFVFFKSISKCLDSRRTGDADRAALVALRRRRRGL